MQTKQDLDDFYQASDPWQYRETMDDWKRKHYILTVLDMFYDHYHRVLDIGAGEGFITEDLPAMEELEAIEISDKAAERLHPRIKRVDEPFGEYDLILACGVLYPHYDYKTFNKWIQDHGTGIVLTSHYDKMKEMNALPLSRQVFYAEFPYREGKQVLRVFDLEGGLM